MLKSEETKIYNWANLLKNNNGGKPMLKDGQEVKNNKGELILIPSFRCSIKINKELASGEYEIKFREKVSESGAIYFSGGILPKLPKKENTYKKNTNY